MSVGKLVELSDLLFIAALNFRGEVVAHDGVVVILEHLGGTPSLGLEVLGSITRDGKFMSKAEDVTNLVLEYVLQDGQIVGVKGPTVDNDILVNLMGKRLELACPLPVPWSG